MRSLGSNKLHLRIERGTFRHAFVLSLFFHLAAVVLFEAVSRLEIVMRDNEIPSLGPGVKQTASKPIEDDQYPAIRMVFVKVNPADASDDPPDSDTQFYSNATTKAANPERDEPSEDPKVDGTQDIIPRVSVRVPDSTPPPPEPEVVKTTQEPPPKPPAIDPQRSALDPSRLLAMNVAPPPVVAPTSLEPIASVLSDQRPKTLREARDGVFEKMRQPGGVDRIGKTQLEVEGTPFGDYDAMVIKAIEQHWYRLIRQNSYVLQRSGMVVLNFRMHNTGAVTNLQVENTEVGEVLALMCRRAVRNPAPFREWPMEMRRAISREFREVRFTFHYR